MGCEVLGFRRVPSLPTTCVLTQLGFVSLAIMCLVILLSATYWGHQLFLSFTGSMNELW